MIEVALSLIVLIALFIPLYRFIKRKRKLNQDFQLEDVDMIHYGPFSGQYSIRKKVLVFLLCSSQMLFAQMLFAEINLSTIDNWGIESWGRETLMLKKTSNSTKSNFFIEMSRPFCICTDPLITTQIANSTYNKGDKIKATMSIDSFKPVDIIFEVVTFLNDTEFLLRPKFYPSLRSANIIKIKFIFH